MMKDKSKFPLILLVFGLSCAGANNRSEETASSQSATREGASEPLSPSSMNTMSGSDAQLSNQHLDAGTSDVPDTDRVADNEKTADISDSASEAAAPEDDNGIVVAGEQAYHIPTTNLLEGDKRLSSIAAVYPIGWSKKGLFAYIAVMDPTVSKGTYYMEFIIENTKNDAVVYRLDWKNYEVDFPDRLIDTLEESSIRKVVEMVWNFYNKRILIALNRREIIQSDGLVLEQTPFYHDDDLIDIVLTRKELEKRTPDTMLDWDFYEIPTTVKIDITSKIYGRKQIFFKKYPCTYYREILGIVRSPFEARVAVLVGKPEADFGESNAYFFEFIGANLTAGFAKRAKQ